MSLFDLKSLVSKEDFADAHEPLNDGIKEVPNAKTVAASVGTGDVGKDTTSQGPAKVVPPKPDTDEATKTEHNVVKESAEKKDSTPAAAPAAKPFPPKAEETDKPTGDKAPPFPPKGETADKAEDDTAETELEHTSEKSAKTDLEKTEKAKEALEAYAPKAKRFDIIGHPTRQAEQIGKAIGFVQRRSGVKGEVTVSAESIDGAIALSQARLAKLGREVRILSQRKVSAEDISDSMGIVNPPLVQEIAVTEAPTEHGAPPMDPAAAAALTEAELDPLDVPVLEIQQIQETLGVLEASQVAIEQYLQIIRANPRMSKQAGAVLHAGLERIDAVCGLKVRATGLEDYVTTPRAAMEDTAVNEKTLLDRAAEIGAKIINWLLKMVEKVKIYTNRYTSGLSTIEKQLDALADKIKDVKDELPAVKVNLNGIALFMNDEFVGDRVTREEIEAVKILSHSRRSAIKSLIRLVTVSLKSGPASEAMADRITELAETRGATARATYELPGGKTLVYEGVKITCEESEDQGTASQLDVPEMTVGELKGNFKSIANYLESLDDTATASLMADAGADIKAAVIKLRSNSKGGDEAVFQKVQTAVVQLLKDAFDPSEYFKTLGQLARTQQHRVNYYTTRIINATQK